MASTYAHKIHRRLIVRLNVVDVNKKNVHIYWVHIQHTFILILNNAMMIVSDYDVEAVHDNAALLRVYIQPSVRSGHLKEISHITQVFER